MGMLDDARASATAANARESDRLSVTKQREADRMNAMNVAAQEFALAANQEKLPLTKINGSSAVRMGWIVKFFDGSVVELPGAGQAAVGADGQWIMVREQNIPNWIAPGSKRLYGALLKDSLRQPPNISPEDIRHGFTGSLSNLMHLNSR